MKIYFILLLIATVHSHANLQELIDKFMNTEFKEIIHLGSSFKPFSDRDKNGINKYYKVKIIKDKDQRHSWVITCYTDGDMYVADIPNKIISNQYFDNRSTYHKKYHHLNSHNKNFSMHCHKFCNNKSEVITVLKAICANEMWFTSILQALMRWHTK